MIDRVIKAESMIYCISQICLCEQRVTHCVVREVEMEMHRIIQRNWGNQMMKIGIQLLN